MNSYIFCAGRLKQSTSKYVFLYRLLKAVSTKNKNSFLVTVTIISQHYKKILGATINHFSISVLDSWTPLAGLGWATSLGSSTPFTLHKIPLVRHDLQGSAQDLGQSEWRSMFILT
jgi:hypothetical protein